MDFESSLKKLEEIIKQLEDGNLSLENALILYKEGSELSESCQKQIENAKLIVEEISAEGN
ncbi:MAG TPA: exodeoxyribonuclease VII small subunit [Oscillospiraceae bacterium]|nr:exodeoxyribonuclease VII small subunit [Oscillospiraceae bacterium]